MEEKADPEVSYQTIEDLYVSPAVKKTDLADITDHSGN